MILKKNSLIFQSIPVTSPAPTTIPAGDHVRSGATCLGHSGSDLVPTSSTGHLLDHGHGSGLWAENPRSGSDRETRVRVFVGQVPGVGDCFTVRMAETETASCQTGENYPNYQVFQQATHFKLGN